MLRLLLCLLVLLLPLPALSDAPGRVELPRPRLLPGATPAQSNATLAYEVRNWNMPGDHAVALIDVATGTLLESYAPDSALPPASVTKLVTTLFALDQLGPTFTFTTRIMATGPIDGNLLHGDLILRGDGDPVLDSDELARLADQLRARGITRITGRFLYDSSILPERPRLVADQPPQVAYNPGISGLNLNFNRVFFEWKNKGAELSLTARAITERPEVRSIRAETVPGQEPVYIYSEDQNGPVWRLAAHALKRDGGRWLPVRKPGRYAAETFRDLAAARGLTLPKPVAGVTPADAIELTRFVRRPLPELSRGMLYHSTNISAEAIGLRASGAANGGASAQAMNAWAEARYGITGLRLADHSGLDDRGRVSARNMARILADAGRSGALDGLVRRYFVPKLSERQQRVDVRAKTGTLNFVRGLAGYLTAPGGRRLAFAIFSSDLEARAALDTTIETPRGAKHYINRAVTFEQALLRRWIGLYLR